MNIPCKDCIVIAQCELINRRYFPLCDIFIDSINKKKWTTHYSSSMKKRTCPYCLSKLIMHKECKLSCPLCKWRTEKLYSDNSNPYINYSSYC